MIRKEYDGIHWLEFELLAQFPRLKHAIFLRSGGQSHGPYSSLNLSLHMGDDPSAVRQNIASAKATMDIERLASTIQVHGDHVIAVDRENWQALPAGDALMTREIALGLKVSHADCQGAIFYDPVLHVAATVHCGWRGQVKDIYSKTISALAATYGSKPADLHVAIGPSLGPTHAEFVHFRHEFPTCFWPFESSTNHFDLWALAAWQLSCAGILSHHIQIAHLCTYTQVKDCFSFRRSQGLTGAHGSVAALL